MFGSRRYYVRRRYEDIIIIIVSHEDKTVVGEVTVIIQHIGNDFCQFYRDIQGREVG